MSALEAPELDLPASALALSSLSGAGGRFAGGEDAQNTGYIGVGRRDARGAERRGDRPCDYYQKTSASTEASQQTAQAQSPSDAASHN